MPSPLNTPTNERLPTNQLWSNIKTRETDMSRLELTQTQTNDITITDQKSNPLIETIDEETNQCTQRHQSSKCANISESQTTDIRRTVRLGLNLDLSHDSYEGKVRKKPAINFMANVLDESLPQVIDASIPLEKQGCFHGYISRTDAENVLRECRGGSYLVRRCQSSHQHYSLSLKCIRGFMHIKIVEQSDGTYTFGTSNLSFTSIPQIVSHYSSNRLPIKGAEHMSLLYPVIDQLL